MGRGGGAPAGPWGAGPRGDTFPIPHNIIAAGWGRGGRGRLPITGDMCSATHCWVGNSKADGYLLADLLALGQSLFFFDRRTRFLFCALHLLGFGYGKLSGGPDRPEWSPPPEFFTGLVQPKLSCCFQGECSFGEFSREISWVCQLPRGKYHVHFFCKCKFC